MDDDFTETEGNKNRENLEEFVVRNIPAMGPLIDELRHAFPTAPDALKKGLEKAARVIQASEMAKALEKALLKGLPKWSDQERMQELTSYVNFGLLPKVEFWENEVEPVVQGTANSVTAILALKKDKTRPPTTALFQKQCLNAMKRKGRKK